MFDSSLVFLVFIFYLYTSTFRQIKYLISIGVLYYSVHEHLFMFSFISVFVHEH
ncbi:hypothetical protein Hanom_Chr01g00088601 [Helianthus anomalus]